MQGIYEDDEETNAMYGVPGAGGGRSPFAPAEDYADLAGARRFALGRQSSLAIILTLASAFPSQTPCTATTTWTTTSPTSRTTT